MFIAFCLKNKLRILNHFQPRGPRERDMHIIVIYLCSIIWTRLYMR